MLHDDAVLRRRIRAVQLGSLAAVTVLALGPEALDLSRSVAGQLWVVLVVLLGALLVERRTRPRTEATDAPSRTISPRGPGRRGSR